MFCLTLQRVLNDFLTASESETVKVVTSLVDMFDRQTGELAAVVELQMSNFGPCDKH